MPSRLLASIDIGSNTVRLLLARQRGKGNFTPLRVERKITRLGGNFSSTAELDPQAQERTLGVLVSYGQLLRQEGVDAVFAVATGVVRKAKNRTAFLERIREEAGLEVRLISGEEEARLTLRGVIWSLPDRASRQLVADVGGWSTEVLWVEGDLPRKTRSVDLGAVLLGERYLGHDPPTRAELDLLEEHIEKVLGEVRQDFEKEGLVRDGLDPRLVGTAGTITTLAAIDQGLVLYDPRKIQGYPIPRSNLQKIYRLLCSLPLEERRKVPGLEKGREDIIIAGGAIAFQLLQVFEMETLRVVASGLLEGVLLEGLTNAEGRIRNVE